MLAICLFKGWCCVCLLYSPVVCIYFWKDNDNLWRCTLGVHLFLQQKQVRSHAHLILVHVRTITTILLCQMWELYMWSFTVFFSPCVADAVLLDNLYTCIHQIVSLFLSVEDHV